MSMNLSVHCTLISLSKVAHTIIAAAQGRSAMAAVTAEARHLQHLLECARELRDIAPALAHELSHDAALDALALLGSTEAIRGITCPRCHAIADAAYEERLSKATPASVCNACGAIFDIAGKRPAAMRKRKASKPVAPAKTEGDAAGVPRAVKRIRPAAWGTADEEAAAGVAAAAATAASRAAATAAQAASAAAGSARAASKSGAPFAGALAAGSGSLADVLDATAGTGSGGAAGGAVVAAAPGPLLVAAATAPVAGAGLATAGFLAASAAAPSLLDATKRKKDKKGAATAAAAAGGGGKPTAPAAVPGAGGSGLLSLLSGSTAMPAAGGGMGLGLGLSLGLGGLPLGGVSASGGSRPLGAAGGKAGGQQQKPNAGGGSSGAGFSFRGR